MIYRYNLNNTDDDRRCRCRHIIVIVRLLLLLLLVLVGSISTTSALSSSSSSSFLSPSFHESMNLFRCNTSAIENTCLYGAMSYMHSFIRTSSNNSNNTTDDTTNEEDLVECVETCVYFTGQVSRSQYHCGKCPSVSDTTTTPPPNITYQPGNLIVEEVGLLLSAGLTAKLIATKDQPVVYMDGTTTSNVPFHRYCDAGATFIDPRPSNSGGWIYVSNSEYRYKFENTPNLGGVGAITFNADGQIIHYHMILQNTTANCGGGKTPWNTWISCEEYENYGTCYEVDPTGEYYIRPPVPTSTDDDDNPNNNNPNTKISTGGYNISMTHVHRGLFESFAYDIVNGSEPHFYVTKDDINGEIRRYTPNLLLVSPYIHTTTATTLPEEDEKEMWKERNFINTPNNPYYHTLLTQRIDDDTTTTTGNAKLEYLIVVPNENDNSRGTYYWTTDQNAGSDNAAIYFPNVEGIDVVGSTLYFISKIYYTMYMLQLSTMTYQNVTTKSGLFDGQPDQVDILLHENSDTSIGNTQLPNTLHETISDDTILLYFTEDTNRTAGIHGRTILGDYVPIVQSTEYIDETVGLAFSPNYQYMYMGYQTVGLLFQISRTDGLPFYGTTLNVKYHNTIDNPIQQ